VSQSLLPFQVDYASHPGFAPHLAWDARQDAAIDEAADILNKLLGDLESALTMKRLTLPEAVGVVNEALRPVMDILLAGNAAHAAQFRPFLERFYLETVRVIVDDLAYFERRNSYVPVINNAAEMALRNELGVKGFLRWSLQPDELAALRRQLKRYLDALETRHQQGGRTREALSINDIDPESVALLSDMFQRRGLNKAVSDVRHEKTQVSGFAVEISPDDNDWWHSRYEDVGLTAPARAAYFHSDESRDVFKAIVYLDDVSDELGPFGFIPASFAAARPRLEWAVARANLTALASPEIKKTLPDVHPTRGVFTSRGARRLFGMLPPRFRLNSHFGFDVLDDSDLCQSLLGQEVKVVAPAGHVIVFDGSRVVHRGGLVRRGRRAALQVVFDVAKENGSKFYRHLTAAQGGPAHVG
jgi:hypothetical protein